MLDTMCITESLAGRARHAATNLKFLARLVVQLLQVPIGGLVFFK